MDNNASVSVVKMLYRDVLSKVFQALPLIERINAGRACKNWLNIAQQTKGCDDTIVFRVNSLDRIRLVMKSPFVRNVSNLFFQDYNNDDSYRSEWITAVSGLLQMTNNLREFYVDGMRMTEKECAMIVDQGFPTTHSLTTISICRCELNEKHAESVARLIQKSTQLQKLTLIECDFGAHGLQLIANSIRNSSSETLIDLCMTANNMQDVGIVCLCKEIVHCQSLASLGLRHNELGTQGIISLTHVLQNNSRLTTIDLSINKINQNNIGILMNSINYITNINLSFCDLGSDGIVIMSNILQNKPSITCLNLQASNMGPTSTKALAELVQNNKSIQQLQIGCHWSDQIVSGVTNVVKMIKANHSWLRVLELGSNCLTFYDVLDIAEAIHSNTHLSSFDISGSHLHNHVSMKALARAFESNTSIISLNLGNCSLQYSGLEILIDHIKNNKTITCLSLKNNFIKSIFYL